MVGLASSAAASQDRRVVIASLALVIALAWLYLWRSAAGMDDMGGMPHIGGALALTMTFATRFWRD